MIRLQCKSYLVTTACCSIAILNFERIQSGARCFPAHRSDRDRLLVPDPSHWSASLDAFEGYGDKHSDVPLRKTAGRHDRRVHRTNNLVFSASESMKHSTSHSNSVLSPVPSKKSRKAHRRNHRCLRGRAYPVHPQPADALPEPGTAQGGHPRLHFRNHDHLALGHAYGRLLFLCGPLPKEVYA